MNLEVAANNFVSDMTSSTERSKFEESDEFLDINDNMLMASSFLSY